MEETNPTWKNHSFTLFIFGGIVVLCSIFFVLGMLVGRNQGQRLAEIAYAEDAAKKPVAVNSEDEFKQDFYTQLTEEKPDLKLQPSPEAASPATANSAPSAAAASARTTDKTAEKTPEKVPEKATEKTTAKPGDKPADKPAEKTVSAAKSVDAKPDASTKATAAAKNAATAKPATSRTTTPTRTPLAKEVFLQVLATRNEKQASTELKKVQSKGFKARIFMVTDTRSVQWHRVYVGPYKESEVNLAKTDLVAKGYKDVITRK